MFFTVTHRRALLGLSTAALLSACGDDAAPLGTPAADASRYMAVQDAAIDQTDTYVTAEATLEYSTVVHTTDPVYDPVTGQNTSELTITPPVESVQIEGGYDVYDRPITNVYEVGAEPDAQTDLADESRTVKALGAGHRIFDAYGNQLPVTLPGDAPSNSPMEGLAYEGAQVTDGILVDARIIESVQNRAPGARFSITGQPGTVRRVGAGLVEITTSFADLPQPARAGEARPATPGQAAAPRETGSIRRTYGKRDDRYVLEELVMESETRTDRGTIRGRQRVAFTKVKWHENKREDEKRRVRRENPSPAPSRAPSPYVAPEDNCLVDEYGNPCQGSGGGDTGGGSYTDPCGPVSDGQNIVLQHGIKSDSTVWKRMNDWLRCDYRLGSQVAPSLPSFSSHSDQSHQLMSRLNGTGQNGYVLIGHSQGGLVSRYTAQRYNTQGRGDMVEGVITIGTPHHGAVLARNMKQNALNGLYSLYGVAGQCGTQFLDVSCHLATMVTQRLLEAFLNQVMNEFAPATQDLQPSSASNNYVNSQWEPFPRYGIQHYPNKRWMLARLAGDNFSAGPDASWGGRNVARRAEWAYQGLRVCNYASIFFGQFWLTRICGTAHRAMDGTDRWWDRMSAPGTTSDGIVHGPSQVYPGALEQRPVYGGDSHVGEAKSDKTRNELDYLLVGKFGTLRRQR